MVQESKIITLNKPLNTRIKSIDFENRDFLVLGGSKKSSGHISNELFNAADLFRFENLVEITLI